MKSPSSNGNSISDFTANGSAACRQVNVVHDRWCTLGINWHGTGGGYATLSVRVQGEAARAGH